MTDLSPTALDVEPLVLGEAITAALLASPGLQVEVVEPGSSVPLPAEPRVAAVDLGAGARLVLVTGKALARQLQVGPPPADELLDACQEPLVAGAAAIGFAPQGEAVETDPSSAAPTGSEVVVALRLLDGDGGHAGTVAFITPAPRAGSDEDDAVLHEFAPLPAPTSALGHTGLELLHGVALGVTAELGRTRMLVKDVLTLAPGSVIELDRAAGSPVDVLVNGTLIARGEVVVIDEEFGIRVTEVIGYTDGGK